jgi:hypothetical protein
MSCYVKAPAAALDYSIDWAAGYLGAATLSGATWSISPVEAGGLTSSAVAISGGRTSVTLSGGVPGHVYAVTCAITLSDGRTDGRALSLRVEAR